jgi:hypothetical protein
MEPGHETPDCCAHVTLTPVVFLISATGPFDTVVANRAAISNQSL